MIKDYAFQNCYNLASITLQEGLNNIGERVFLMHCNRINNDPKERQEDMQRRLNKY